MRHVDPDLLALLALGENAGDASDREHVASCEVCRTEVENLAHAADVGRSTIDAGELLQPSARVWSAIRAEVEELEEGDEPERLAPVTPLRRPGWIAPVAATAAAVLVVGSIGVAWAALQPTPATVLASAQLDAFPDWVGATGSATVTESADGSRMVDVTVDLPAGEEGFREVWLISSDTSQLVSLGIVDGATGSFTIPAGLDLTRFDLVDISEEPFDGDPTHSGDSIVRGQLS